MPDGDRPDFTPAVERPNTLKGGPDARGRFGRFGGRFVAETLMPLILELEQAWDAARGDPAFRAELDEYLKNYVGRPSPLWHAKRLSETLGGARIYFKREELNHTGSHKLNNVMGQILLARRMGRTRIIAETGAGQHGVATATVCALFGLRCVVFMGATDVERQQPNVFRMRLLGAEVRSVTAGAGTLKDAMNEAMRDWVANVDDTYYLIGTVAGPHPYPAMVGALQQVIGEEAREQILDAEGRLPDQVVASVGGGSNAMGIFHAFLDDPDVRLIGVEAAGRGLDSGEQAASISRGRPGCCTATAPICCRTRTARSRKRTASARVSTTLGSAPSTPGCTSSDGPSMSASPTPRRSRRSACARVRRASSRRSSARNANCRGRQARAPASGPRA